MNSIKSLLVVSVQKYHADELVTQKTVSIVYVFMSGFVPDRNNRLKVFNNVLCINNGVLMKCVYILYCNTFVIFFKLHGNLILLYVIMCT